MGSTVDSARDLGRGRDRPAGPPLAELEARWPENVIEPTLARIAALTDLLGDPQRTYPVIHVTGTNGKSSTARMIESLLRSFGLRTGLFTSPHLVDARERICFDGEPIEAERLLRHLGGDRPLRRRRRRQLAAPTVACPLSYFEVMTALAFAAFADAPVDVAIVEVGLGGGWDSTNVADGTVAVITPIGLDHRDYLGDTIADDRRARRPASSRPARSRCWPSRSSRRPRSCWRGPSRSTPWSRARDSSSASPSRGVAVGGQLLGAAGAARRVRRRLPAAVRRAPGPATPPSRWPRSRPSSAASARSIRISCGPASRWPPRPAGSRWCDAARRSCVDAAHNPHGAAALAAAVRRLLRLHHRSWASWGCWRQGRRRGPDRPRDGPPPGRHHAAVARPRALDADDLGGDRGGRVRRRPRLRRARPARRPRPRDRAGRGVRPSTAGRACSSPARSCSSGEARSGSLVRPA